jgi:hypothetical protein
MDKDQIAKFMCFAAGCLMAFYVLIYLFPYVVLFFALMGAGYMYQEWTRNNRR